MSCQLYPDPHRSKREIRTFLVKESGRACAEVRQSMNEFHDMAVLRYGIVVRRDKRG
jgi:hypothetical protein